MEKIDLKKEFLLWLALLVPVIYIICAWGLLPDQIPVHFGIDGTPNGWGGRWMILLEPAINIGVYLLMIYLPSMDPKRMDNAEFDSMFYKIRVLLVVFLSLMGILATQAAIVGSMNKGIARYMPQILFLFIAIMGNLLINIKPNWFIGIRTPWTLSSDAVWKQTHQVMGKVWFYGGILMAVICFFVPSAFIVGMIAGFALGSVGFALAYSYWLFKKEKENAAE